MTDHVHRSVKLGKLEDPSWTVSQVVFQCPDCKRLAVFPDSGTHFFLTEHDTFKEDAPPEVYALVYGRQT